MKRSIENKHIVDTLFVLTLFAVFVICSLLIIAFGANIYQNTTNNLEEHFNITTSTAYINEKLHQCDASDAIDIIQFGDSDAFRIHSIIDDTEYYTYIYLHDNYLKELYTKADNDLGPEAGKNLLPVNRFNISEQSPGLYSYLITDSHDSTLVVKISSKCD